MSAKKIMVIDDDPQILEIIGFILEDEGYEVELSSNGQNLLLRQDNLPDVILMDVWMPGIYGGTLGELIKMQAHTSHIPIIMMSASKDLEKIAQDSGATDFLHKPFDVADLSGIVKKHINYSSSIGM
ncbi:MAG: response regulator [Sphingobacteriaceae bacterium]